MSQTQDAPTLMIETVAFDKKHLPHYATSDSAGADLKACVDKPIILNPGETALISTGLRVAIPSGYEIQIRPRSGLALKHGVTVLNTPGTIDADYRGDVGVVLINHGKEPFTIEPNMRIAQLVIAKVIQGQFILKETLAATQRGEGGFGHTGFN